MRDPVKIISLFGKSSYGRNFPSLSLLYERNLFLECRCHDVIIPIRSASAKSLNVFEETVLRLLGTYGKSAQEISAMSCLPSDFVKAICSGLRKRNFVNDNNALTEAGKDLLSGDTASGGVENKLIRVLTLADTGRLLAPVLADDSHDYEGFFDGGLSMTVDSNNKGEEVTVDGYYLTVPKDKRTRRQIYPHDVKKILRDYNRTSPEGILQSNLAMTVSQQGSRVFLHVKCAIQRGFVDQFIVSDGTQIIGGDLVQYLQDNHGDYVEKFFAAATTFGRDKSTEKPDVARRKYYKVAQLLDETESFSQGTDRDSVAQNSELEKNKFVKLLGAVEHALNYFCREHPLSTEHEQLLYAQTPAENFRTLALFAEQLNLNVAGNGELLSRLSKSNFNFYRPNGVPNLFFVLPLSIVAGVENPSSTFAKIAKATPDLLKLFTTLNRLKSFRHGSEDSRVATQDYDRLEREAKIFINELLPDFNREDTPKTSNFAEDVSQERLNTIVALKETLGSKIFYEAGENLRNTLIRLSPYYTGEKMLSPMDFVNNLYICLESYTRTKARNFSLPTKNLSNVPAKLDEITPLPTSLKTVSAKMFKAAANGRGASLGAYVLVLFGALPRELFTEEDAREIFATTDKIISLRQHANNVELNVTLTEADLISLREETFDVLRRMEEF